ncbi:MAG TPA: M56 family metallopeptidase [Pyrinomonadaceae bacterium]|nr:M56 family metallopeptidase [Pyrinomonadaceae bacterium]
MPFYEPFVEWSRWGWPLLGNHLWQATLFSLFVLIVCAPLTRAPARVRYSLWLVTLLKFVVPGAVLALLVRQTGIDGLFAPAAGSPAAGLALSPFLSPVASQPVVVSAARQFAPSGETSAAAYVAAVHDQGHWYGVLTLVWLAGCAILFGSWLRQRRLLSAAVRAGRVARCGREFETLRRVSSWLGLRRKVTLVVSPEIAEPGVWRTLRPVVVLPEGVAERLSDDELEAVMMHEMVHVERWDNLVGFVQRTVCCLLWFHPLVWLLDRRLLAEREQSCDDTVIRLSGDSKVYVSGITKVCRHSMGWELKSGLSSATGSDLKKRLKRIMAADISRIPSVLHRALLGAVVAVLFVLSAASGIINGGNAPSQDKSSSAGKADPRFIVADAEAAPSKHAEVAEVRASTVPPLPPQAAPPQVKEGSPAPVEVKAGPDRLEQMPPPEQQSGPSIVALVNQPNQPNATPLPPQPPQEREATRVSAAFIPASMNHADLTEFAGRYEVDPTRVENFILDITLERGELWLKPSHASKRRLLLAQDMRLADTYSDFVFSALRDRAGRVVGLRLDSWDSSISARKLALNQPSLRGNVTFTLSAPPNARIVAVAGSFNNWNQSQFLFARVGNEWVCKINLPPGEYEYKFIIDGDWLLDPLNPKKRNDGRGHVNSVLVVE